MGVCDHAVREHTMAIEVTKRELTWTQETSLCVAAALPCDTPLGGGTPRCARPWRWRVQAKLALGVALGVALD